MEINKYKKLAENTLLISLFLIPSYFIRISVLGFKTNIFEISILLSLVLALIYYFSAKQKITVKLGSVWSLLFILSAFFAMFLSSDKSKAIGIFKGWFFVPYILYLLLINLFSKKDFPKIATVILISAFVVSTWAILQHFGVKYFLPNQNDTDLQNFLIGPNKRVFSVFESPNYLAMFLAPIIPIALLAFKNAKKIGTKIAFSCMIFSMLIALYWTDSRSGIIAFLAVGAFLSVRFLIQKKSLINYTLMILIIIFIINSVYYFMKIDIHPNSERGRGKIYNYSVQMIKHHPIAGVGLGSYSSALANEAKNDQEFLVYFLPYAYHPHNLYMAIWLNLGLIGLVLFIILLAKFLANFSDNFNSWTNIIILSAILTILIQGIFDTTYFKNDLAAIFWLLGAMSYLAKSANNKIVHDIDFIYRNKKMTLDW